MGWLYKFLIQVIEDECCTNCSCFCGTYEFRATLISKLKCYKKIPNIDKLTLTQNPTKKFFVIKLDLNFKIN